MRTILNTDDIRNIIDEIFNGNLWKHKASAQKIAYENQNSPEIILVDEFDGSKTKSDLAQYLNIKFYSWRERLMEKSEELGDSDVFNSWVQSLNGSMNEAYALVDVVDDEVTMSQDIDSATKLAEVTFIIQSDKVANLDYYINKLRNQYIGVPQIIQNSFGEKIKAFILLGVAIYDQEPFASPLGQTVIVKMNVRLSYLMDAMTYDDTKIEISLDGDDKYNADGTVQGETKYSEMPITKITWQNIVQSNAVPTQFRPANTGFVGTSISTVKTFSYYDFNKGIALRLNDLFWSLGAVKIDGKTTTSYTVNIPIYIRITNNGHTYVYRDMVDNIQKNISNNDFNISSITLKGYAVRE